MLEEKKKLSAIHIDRLERNGTIASTIVAIKETKIQSLPDSVFYRNENTNSLLYRIMAII